MAANRKTARADRENLRGEGPVSTTIALVDGYRYRQMNLVHQPGKIPSAFSLTVQAPGFLGIPRKRTAAFGRTGFYMAALPVYSLVNGVNLGEPFWRGKVQPLEMVDGK